MGTKKVHGALVLDASMGSMVSGAAMIDLSSGAASLSRRTSTCTALVTSSRARLLFGMCFCASVGRHFIVVENSSYDSYDGLSSIRFEITVWPTMEDSS
jgi:hypothetical protein